MRPPIFIVLVVVGSAIGLWHLSLAFGAVFVFREGEPLSSWLFIISGPGATLVCVLVGAWRPLIGGIMLVGLAVASAIVLAIGVPIDVLLPAAEMIMLPMFLLGAAFIFLARRFRHFPSVAPNAVKGA